MNFQLRFPFPEPPRRYIVFMCSPSEHLRLAGVWRKHPEHPRSAVMVNSHRVLARIIQRRLEEGSARIEAERIGYRDARRWMAARGWL
jgi:hypothetical protein